MTRINLVPPTELCDQHLLAEHRELTRIPNAVAKGKFSLKGQPEDYKLGEGHVRFFFNKLAFLKQRYVVSMYNIFGQRSYLMILIFGKIICPQKML